MAELAPPVELLDLVDRQTVSFRIVRWEEGALTIRPRHQPEGKRVSVLRVHVPAADKPTFPHYYDLTSARLIAQLRGVLLGTEWTAFRFTIRAEGIAPKRYYPLEVARA